MANPPKVTTLSKEDEAKYRAWMQRSGQTKADGQNVDSNFTGTDYDYRGFFKKYGAVNVQQGQHFTDEFKLPNHPTFSDESIYAVGPNKAKAGHWDGDTFIPPTKGAGVTKNGSLPPELYGQAKDLPPELYAYAEKHKVDPVDLIGAVKGQQLSVADMKRIVDNWHDWRNLSTAPDSKFKATSLAPDDQRIVSAMRSNYQQTGEVRAESGAKKKASGISKDGPVGQVTLYSDGSMQLPKTSKAGQELTIKTSDGKTLGLAKFVGSGKGDFGQPFQWTAKSTDASGKTMIRGGWAKSDAQGNPIPDASGDMAAHQWLPANQDEAAKVQQAQADASTAPGGISPNALPHGPGGGIAVIGEHTVLGAPPAGGSSIGNLPPALANAASKASAQGSSPSTGYNSDYLGGLSGDEAILASSQYTPPKPTLDNAAISAGIGGIDQLGPLGAQVASRGSDGSVQGGFIPAKWVQGPDGSYHVETQETSTVDGQMRRLYGMNPQELAMMQGALFQAGFYGNTAKSSDIKWGVADGDTATAWTRLLMDTQRLNAAGQLVSVDQVLASRSAAGATSNAAKQAPTISPQEVAASANAMALQVLGRRATPEEERLVMAAVNKQMADQFHASDAAGYQTGQQPASVSQVAQDVLQANAPQEAVGNNFLNTFGAFQQMLGGLVH